MRQVRSRQMKLIMEQLSRGRIAGLAIIVGVVLVVLYPVLWFRSGPYLLPLLPDAIEQPLGQAALHGVGLTGLILIGMGAVGFCSRRRDAGTRP